MRTVTGAFVVPSILRDTLPESIVAQLEEDFSGEPTPVTEPFRKP
jgi:hypothetical protein